MRFVGDNTISFLVHSTYVQLRAHSSTLLFILKIPCKVGRRGLVGLFVMCKSHGIKGRGIESRSFSFFYSFPYPARRNVSLRKWAATKRDVRRERRNKEEEPAGASGKRLSSRLNTSPRGLVCKSGLISGRSILTCRKKMHRGLWERVGGIRVNFSRIDYFLHF